MGIFDFFKRKDTFRPVATPSPPSQPKSKPQGYMTKDEIEMVLIEIKIKGEEALLIKVYKNGCIVRNGAGGIPRVQVGCLGEVRDRSIWDKLLESLSPELLEVNGQQIADNIKTPYSYTVVFFGDSANGDTGEHADWKRSQGLHIESDLNHGPNHPLMAPMDRLAVAAVGLTNSWYYDMVVLACFGMKAEGLQGMMSSGRDMQPIPTFTEFVTQLKMSPAAPMLSSYPQGKVYVQDGTGNRFKMVLSVDGDNMRYDFVPTA